MPLPVITDVIRCAVRGTCPNGQPWVNVCHVKKDPTLSMVDAINATHVELTRLYAGTAHAGVAAAWKGNASTGATCDDISYTPLNGTSASTVLAVGQPGVATGDAMPPDAAIVVSLRSGLRGPRHRGRQYLAGFVESVNQSNGRVLALAATQIHGQYTGTLAALLTALVPMHIASYKYATSVPVLTVSVDNKWDRQRRRQ